MLAGFSAGFFILKSTFCTDENLINEALQEITYAGEPDKR
jgi:hypothetical protein